MADSVEVMLQPRMLSESYKLLVAQPYDVAALRSHGSFMGACMRLNVVEHSGDVPSARVWRPKGVSDADWTGLLDDRLGRALFGRMRARMVADVEEHFDEALKTLSEENRKRISEAVSKVEDGTVNPDAVLSVKCAFVRIGVSALHVSTPVKDLGSVGPAHDWLVCSRVADRSSGGLISCAAAASCAGRDVQGTGAAKREWGSIEASPELHGKVHVHDA